jgi:type IV secretion system protein VirD4
MRRPGWRTDVAPIGWELPAAGGLCWLAVAALLLPTGQGAASWLFGGGFVWPHGSLLHSIGGLLGGHPGRGVAVASITDLPPSALIYLLIAVLELAAVAAAVWLGVLWWRLLGPGALQGMASRSEVERVLGVSNLRRRRKVIRPDLFGTGREVRA